MSNSNLWKGLLFRGFRLSTSVTTPFFFRYCRVVSTNNNRWLSSFSSSGGIDPMMKIERSGFPRIPWLFLSPTPEGRILPAFDPSNRCYYDIPIPKEVQGPDNSVRGSGYGWLVMVKSSGEYDYLDEPTEMILSLYNPISRAHIPLPSIIPPAFLGNAHVWCNPARASPGQTLMSINFGYRRILIYNQGDDDWSIEIVGPPDGHIASTVYHEGDATLYVVYRDGRLSVLDLASLTLRPLMNTPPPEIESLRGSAHIESLVVGAAGDLLLVMENWECPQYHYALKLDKRCLKWVLTGSIGDHTLFMYRNYMHAISMLCDPAITDAQANQIYIFNQGKTYTAGGRPPQDTDAKIAIEVSGDVKLCDLMPASGEPKSAEMELLPLFKTSDSPGTSAFV